MKKTLFLLLCFVLPVVAQAQVVTYGTVSGTAVDSGSTPYSLGTILVQFTTPSGGQCGLGSPPNFAFQKTYTVALDVTGSFAGLSLPANSSFNCSGSQWSFTVSSQGNYGIATAKLTIGSGAQNISTSISALARIAWTPGLPPPPGRAGQSVVSLANGLSAWGGSDLVVQGQPNFFFDLFNRTGANLGANYTDFTNGFSSSPSTAVGTNATNYNVTQYSVGPSSATQNVTAVVNPSGTFYVGAAVRINGTAQTSENSYACIESSTQFFLVKRVAMTPSNAGTQTVLLGPTNVTTTSADVINTRIVGNTVSCNWNRTGLTMEYNDTAGGGSGPITTAGTPGLIMDGNGSSISSFSVRNSPPPSNATVNVVVDGDSTTEGAGIFSAWTDYLSLPAGKVASVTNVAVDGKGLCTNRPAGGVNGGGSAGNLEQMLATGLTVVDPLFTPGMVNISVLGPTVNDIANSGTPTTAAATEYACLVTYVANRHSAGWKVVVTPALSDSSNDTVMQQYNQLITANTAGADAVVILPQSMVGTHAYSNTTFFGDGVHPTQFAATSVIAPAVSAAIASLL